MALRAFATSALDLQALLPGQDAIAVSEEATCWMEQGRREYLGRAAPSSRSAHGGWLTDMQTINQKRQHLQAHSTHLPIAHSCIAEAMQRTRRVLLVASRLACQHGGLAARHTSCCGGGGSGGAGGLCRSRSLVWCSMLLQAQHRGMAGLGLQQDRWGCSGKGWGHQACALTWRAPA
jgi:hypothetical protein